MVFKMYLIFKSIDIFLFKPKSIHLFLPLSNFFASPKYLLINQSIRNDFLDYIELLFFSLHIYRENGFGPHVST